MDEPRLAGLDIGTANTKAAIFSTSGRVLGGASVPTPTHYPRPGWAYHRADELWEAAARALREAIARSGSGRVTSLAVASVAEAAVPLDADGRPTHETIAWFDQRTQPQAERLAGLVGMERLFLTTGLPLEPIYGLCKLLWLKENEPEAYKRTTCWLNVADYIAYRLSGVTATDHSLASRTLALDLRKLEWDVDILVEAGVSPDVLAPLAQSGTALGEITTEASEATGLNRDAIVAAGGHDHVCGALAVGIVAPGMVLDSLGTAEALFLPLREPISDPKLGARGYSQGAHVVAGGYYVIGGLYTSGASIEWVRRLVGGVDHNILVREAEDVPAGSLGVSFLPYLRLASPPQDDPKARGAFVGLSTDVTRGALYRSVLEGLAFDFRNSLEALEEHTGAHEEGSIYAIGGGTRNDLLMRIKAAALDETITMAGVEEATSLGAAILGGVGAGVWPDAAAALGDIEHDWAPVDPDPKAAVTYEALFSRVFKNLYPSLSSLHHAIDGLTAARQRD
jgi:xylulokinase